MDRTHVRSWIGVALLLAVLLLGGCRSGVSMTVKGGYQPMPAGGVDFGPYNQGPRPRLGALPYPGLLTLFDLADPDRLGRHGYNGSRDEEDRGILYTCRGGFVDLAHTRKCIDLCKYAAVRAEFALMNNWDRFQIKGMEPSVYVVYLNYPPFWQTLPPEQKQRLARELSIRIGQRMAMTMITWHEVLTWFGYKAFPLVSEKRSAFSYDDTGSHALGVLVGGRALRDTGRGWDEAVTEAMSVTLKELNVVSEKEAKEAIDLVEGKWWRGTDPLKRQFDTGLDGRPIEPWIVRNLSFCPNATPIRYEVPRIDQVEGYDFRGLMRVEIKPKVLESGRIRAALPDKPETIDADRDLPVLIDHIRQWHIRREGEQVAKAY